MKKISLKTSIFVGMNAMVGAGIVALPGRLMQIGGSSSLYGFMLSIILVLCLGLSLARMIVLYPNCSWNYDFPKLFGGIYFGQTASFLYTAGMVVAMGLVVQQSGVWLHDVIPFLDEGLLRILAMMGIAFMVIAGMEVSSLMQTLLGFFVIVPLVIVAFLAWSHANLNLVEIKPFFSQIPVIQKVLPATIFGLIGFESIISLAPIMEEAKKNTMYAMGLTILLVGFLNLFLISGILFSIPQDTFNQGLNETLAQVLMKAFPNFQWSAVLLYIGSLFAILGTMSSILWSLSTLLNHLCFKGHKKSLKFVTLLLASGMLFFSFTVDGGKIIDLAVFSMVSSYVMSILHLLTLKQEWKSGFNLITIVGVLAAVIMMKYAGSSLIS